MEGGGSEEHAVGEERAAQENEHTLNQSSASFREIRTLEFQHFQFRTHQTSNQNLHLQELYHWMLATALGHFCYLLYQLESRNELDGVEL